MNRLEAKAILQMYRPGGQDANDPDFAEALAWVERDPELAAWFAQQQRFDAQMSSSLRAIPVPPEMRVSLAAEWLTAPRAATPAQQTAFRAALAWLNQPLFSEWRLLGTYGSRRRQVYAGLVATLLGLGVVAGAWFMHASNTFARYREEIVPMPWHASSHLDQNLSELTEVRQWLAQQEADSQFVVPRALTDHPVYGTRVIDWRGRKVVLVCFLNGPQHLHLFISPNGDFEDAPTAQEPQFVMVNRWATVSWTQGGKTYILAGMKDNAVVRNFRASRRWTFDS